MQVKFLLIFLTTLLVASSSKLNMDLYIMYEPGSYVAKIESPQDQGFQYSLKIDQIEDEHTKFKTSIYLQAVSPPDTLSNSNFEKLEVKDIFWLNEQYLKAFEYFKNDPPGLSKSGEILSFELNQPDRDIYILEKIGSVWLRTKVEQFFEEH